MPCRDYETDRDYQERSINEMKERLDRATRVACKALRELESNGIIEAIMLADREVYDWWTVHKKEDEKERRRLERKRKREEEKIRLAQVKKDVLNRLTDDEKKALGIKNERT